MFWQKNHNSMITQHSKEGRVYNMKVNEPSPCSKIHFAFTLGISVRCVSGFLSYLLWIPLKIVCTFVELTCRLF